MSQLTTIEVHGPVSEVLQVLLRMRGTKQTTKMGETSRLQLRHATATVIWLEHASRTVIHVKDPKDTGAATAACNRLISQLPYAVARFDTGSVVPLFVSRPDGPLDAPGEPFAKDVDRETG